MDALIQTGLFRVAAEGVDAGADDMDLGHGVISSAQLAGRKAYVATSPRVESGELLDIRPGMGWPMRTLEKSSTTMRPSAITWPGNST